MFFPSTLYNYRPVTNVPIIDKVINKAAFNQVNNYLDSNGLTTFNQASVNIIALKRVLNAIRLNTDTGKYRPPLVLIDLSTVFDTADQ